MKTETFYHIYNHAIGNENLFRKIDNYSYFLKRYAFFINPVANTFAYALMPNHFHFLIRIKSTDDLLLTPSFEGLKPSKDNYTLEIERTIILQFSHLFNSYAQAYNKMFDRKGALFIHAFKRKEVNNDAYLKNLILYIHANPVIHGFVSKMEDWAFSSYDSLVSDKTTLLKRKEVLEWFEGKDEFVQYHQQEIFPLEDFDFE